MRLGFSFNAISTPAAAMLGGERLILFPDAGWWRYCGRISGFVFDDENLFHVRPISNWSVRKCPGWGWSTRNGGADIHPAFDRDGATVQIHTSLHNHEAKSAALAGLPDVRAALEGFKTAVSGPRAEIPMP